MNFDKTQWSWYKFIYLSYLSYDTYSVSHSQVTLGVALHVCSEKSLSDMGCDNIYTDNFYMATVLPYTQISVQCYQLSHKSSVLYHFQHHPNIRRFIYIYTHTHTHTHTHIYIYICNKNWWMAHRLVNPRVPSLRVDTERDFYPVVS